MGNSSEDIGWWLSAALDDPNVAPEMKTAIGVYFSSRNDLEQIIADQMAQIEQLSDRVESLEYDLAMEAPDPYWQGVYDNIRAAWDKWALAELGTASPSPLDLEGRPELAELWEAVR